MTDNQVSSNGSREAWWEGGRRREGRLMVGTTENEARRKHNPPEVARGYRWEVCLHPSHDAILPVSAVLVLAPCEFLPSQYICKG
jgi:hypothetical protein